MRLEALPLGNGRLGVAVWSASGFTAQLNRSDTMPGRLSPGEIVIPGLAKLTSAKDYSGRLGLYDGEFRGSGGGMTAVAYVQPNTDLGSLRSRGQPPIRVRLLTLIYGSRAPRRRRLAERSEFYQRRGKTTKAWGPRGDDSGHWPRSRRMAAVFLLRSPDRGPSLFPSSLSRTATSKSLVASPRLREARNGLDITRVLAT
jgi:hypothetical protein